MPISKPKKDESRDNFIARCMSEMNKEYPNNKQRYAICIRQWDHKGAIDANTVEHNK